MIYKMGDKVELKDKKPITRTVPLSKAWCNEHNLPFPQYDTIEVNPNFFVVTMVIEFTQDYYYDIFDELTKTTFRKHGDALQPYMCNTEFKFKLGGN